MRVPFFVIFVVQAPHRTVLSGNTIPFDVLFVLYCPKLFAMQQFKLSRLALLKNDEHAMLIEQVCRILDDHPVDDGHVRRAAEKVKSHLDALKGIKCRSGKHALTPVLAELAEKRRRALISLKMRVKAALWSPLSEENEPARVLKFRLDKQGERPVNGSCMARTRCVDEMLQEAVCDAAVGEALAALNLMPLADYLRETNEAFKAAFMQRNEEWAREEKPDSRAVRKAADKDVKLLMNVLVVQAAMEGESRYRELTGELGRLFAYYWNTLAVRKGRRTAEKAKKDTETRQEIAGVRKSIRVKIAEKTEEETEKAGTPPAIDGMKKGGRIATAEKEANSRPANTAERKGHQVAAAVTERKGHHAAAEQGAQNPPAITGMRKGSPAAVEAEGKKNTESITAVDQVPAKVHPVRAATPQENLTPHAITGMRKGSPAAVEAEGKKNTESITAVDQVPAKVHLVRAAKPQENLTRPEIIGIKKVICNSTFSKIKTNRTEEI